MTSESESHRAKVAEFSTYWHEQYILGAQLAYPEVTKGHDLKVGWKVTQVDGTSYGGYYWPIVNGDHDVPVLHEASDWDESNYGSCPETEGDGLCLVTDAGIGAATTGVVESLAHCVGHALVYPTDLARGKTTGKHRVPWAIDVDCFDVVALVRAGAVANLRYANLRYANLDDANLHGANLYGANLRYANLRYVNLYGANLDGADANYATIWPEGFNPNSAGVVMS